MLIGIISLFVASAGIVVSWRTRSGLRRIAGTLLVLAGLGLASWRPPARAELAREQTEAAQFCADVGFTIASWQRAFSQGVDGPPTRDAHRHAWDVLRAVMRSLGTHCMVDYNACADHMVAMAISEAPPEPAIAELVAAFETRTTCRRTVPRWER